VALPCDHAAPTVLSASLFPPGDRHHAEDLAQSVLAKAYVRWVRIASTQRPEAYLNRVLVNEQLRWWRKQASSEVAGDMAPDRAAVGDAGGGCSGTGRRLGAAHAAAAVLVLRSHADVADAEIAGALLADRLGPAR
jgi:DNA-directed RNA polymerase specialized sigma24 family protein